MAATLGEPDTRSRLNSNVSDLDVDLTENPSYIKTVTLLNEFYGQGLFTIAFGLSSTH